MNSNEMYLEKRDEFYQHKKEIDKLIGEKKKELAALYAKKKELYNNRPRSEQKKVDKLVIDYDKASEIANKINRFHFCRDAEQKMTIFFTETIYLGQKSRNEVYSFDEMMNIISAVKSVLKMYKGTILYDEAKDEFVSYYRYIEDNGIDGVLYEDLKFIPYTGSYNYIG